MRIMIAEDDPTSRTALAGVLAKSGYEVVVAAHGHAAWQALRQSGAPELAILDWMLPEMDGLEVVRRVRAQPSARPPYIIILTAKEGKADVVAGLGAGANDYLTKPFDVGELLARVEVGRRMVALQDSLRENEALLSRAQHLAHIGSWALDDTPRVLRCSDEALHIFGYTPDVVSPTPELFLQSIHPDDRDLVQAVLAAARDRQTPLSVEHRVILPTGEERVVHQQAEMMRGGGGPSRRWLGTVQDITERKRAEAEKALLEGQLQQARKMESVGRLAGGVAHSFNNLLMGIMNYVELCRDGLPAGHPVRSYLNEITADAQTSADITRQLLAFASKQVIVPEVLDLNEVLPGMLNLLRHLVGEGIDLTWTPGETLWAVRMDRGQISQTLLNLCLNARDAIAGVGKLTVETRNETLERADAVAHPGAVPGDYVLLVVSDDGRGMDAETLDHLFEPFFTTKGVGNARGLGLAAVYGIVRQNHGFIDVSSKPGRGATFRLHLPRAAAPADAASPPAALAELPGGTETILVVEDEKSIRVTTCRLLELLGYTVLVAAAPAEALRVADAHPGPIHLLLTDVVMPGMSGLDLAGLLVERRPATKCLYMSGYTAEVIMPHRTQTAGMQFLAKPSPRDELARKVREMLDPRASTTP
jgi:PAS domain S-box-containing protein